MLSTIQNIEIAFFLVLLIGGGGFIAYRESYWSAKVKRLEDEIDILMRFAKRVDPNALAQVTEERSRLGQMS